MKSNAAISDADLIEIVHEITGWNENQIRKHILEDRSIHMLKLDQLKKLIKSLLRKGCNVSSAGNKADLVQNISNFLQSKADSTQGKSSSTPIINPPRVPLPVKNSNATLTMAERAIVEDLFQLEGLTKDEILEALFEVPAQERNTDSVLLSILNKRQQVSCIILIVFCFSLSIYE